MTELTWMESCLRILDFPDGPASGTTRATTEPRRAAPRLPPPGKG